MESNDTEWKEAWDEKCLRTLCAFNNCAGGTMTIGKDDNGNVTGVSNPKKLLKIIPDSIRNKMVIKASVGMVLIEGKDCIEIKVEKGDRIADLDGVFYERVGSTTQKLTGDKLRSLILSDRGMSWTDLPAAGDKTISEEAVKHFIDAGKTSKRLPDDIGYDADMILERFDLINEEGSLTNAGWLLFGKNSSRSYEGTFVKIGEFSPEGELRREDRIFVPVIMQPDAVMYALYEKYIPGLFEYEGARRLTVFRYPHKAVREALINAIIHKRYDDFEPITVRVDPNRLSIYNDGELPEGWTVENLKRPHNSIRRNKKIADVFHHAGYIESWGKGIDLILDECRENGNPEPEFNVRHGGLDVIFTPNRTIKYGLPLKLPIGLSENEVGVCKLIDENNEITVAEIIEQLKISRSTVKRVLESLIDKGIIIRTGSKKTGSWRFK